jgi:15-cis-phytoene synthase
VHMSNRDLDAAGITDPQMRESYERCRELNAQHGKTYYMPSTDLLAMPMRSSMIFLQH